MQWKDRNALRWWAATPGRPPTALRALARAGYSVGGPEMIAVADSILLPLPLDAARTPLAELLRAARPGTLALGGMLSVEAKAIAAEAGVELVVRGTTSPCGPPEASRALYDHPQRHPHGGRVHRHPDERAQPHPLGQQHPADRLSAIRAGRRAWASQAGSGNYSRFSQPWRRLGGDRRSGLKISPIHRRQRCSACTAPQGAASPRRDRELTTTSAPCGLRGFPIRPALTVSQGCPAGTDSSRRRRRKSPQVNHDHRANRAGAQPNTSAA